MRIDLCSSIWKKLKIKRNESSRFHLIGSFLLHNCYVPECPPWHLFLEIVSKANYLFLTFHRDYLRKAKALLLVLIIFRVHPRCNHHRFKTNMKLFVFDINHCFKLLEVINNPTHPFLLILQPHLFYMIVSSRSILNLIPILICLLSKNFYIRLNTISYPINQHFPIYKGH